MATYVMDAGTYFVGDIREVLSADVWSAVSTFKFKKVHWINKSKLLMFDAYEKRVTRDEDEISLESGVIGIVHTGCIAKDLRELADVPYGFLHDFSTNFTINGKRKSILINKDIKIFLEERE